MPFPAFGPSGKPQLNELGMPMLGCCDCGTHPCSGCECTTGSEAITLSVFATPVEFVGLDECDASGYCDNLAGVKELEPWPGCGTGAAQNYCSGGCYAATCQNGFSPKIIGFHYPAAGLLPNDGVWVPDPNDISGLDDCAFYTFDWGGSWFVHVDRMTRKISVFLAFMWVGAIGCPSVCGIYTAAYIRWEYEFDTCASIAHPAHTGTKIWHAWLNDTPATDTEDSNAACPCIVGTAPYDDYMPGVGGPGPYRGVCEIQPDEVDATSGDWLGSPCELFLSLSSVRGFPTAPSEGVYLQIKNLTPPAVSITGCGDACCSTEGGPPTAIIDLGGETGCFITATDISTPGTCGAIVKRLWLLESWSEEPTGGSLSCAERQQAWASEEEGMDATSSIFKPVSGCGRRWWRLTLIVWDALDCFDVATTDVYNCCSCEDNGEPCPGTVGGSLGITLTNEELCEYELCATLPVDETGHAEGVCGEGTPFIEWQLNNGGCAFFDEDACDCDDIFAGACYPSCGGGLGNGDCTTITIESSTSLRWRVWDNTCGCPGPWTYVPLVCAPCECCETENDGILESIDISITDIAGGLSGDCADCLQFNDIYNVPGTSTCYGNDIFTQPTACSEGVEHDRITISWQITCDDTSTTLTVNIQMGQTFPAFITFEKTVTHASGVIIDCSELSGTLTRTYCACDGSALIKCNAENIHASANLNFI